MADELFDIRARALRRDRACRTGPVLFALERAFEDVLDRLALVSHDFHSALLIGAPDAGWPKRLQAIAPDVTVLDPGPEFAGAAGGGTVVEDALDLEPGTFDLAVALGTLDSVNDLPGALLRLRLVLKPNSLLIGTITGGETLPRLRQAMRAADAQIGAASPRVHPRIEPSALAGLLASGGFEMPVVDVDRVPVSYRDLMTLVRDLRGMGATNVLSQRTRRPLTRAALAAAEASFAGGSDGRTVENFELLHFAAWSPTEQG